ncbi:MULTISPECIES: A24 family peptidase [unclassified Mesorhizobium]|uniref:prepilin peptidase n=1 Tax=unclassified Mesorhizobium TaxID=325217 RepID=UPI00112B8558|nr:MULTISPECIES: A24 family peptidase [unclassified Mesorhizobium]TPI46461.1 prepilin peptidase [Mesorhizobium sp. B3-1-1]TPJ57473.1 prepilin peptidase [Mesorhizobium sp. B2-6-7]TPJ77546.1 prepilin peptidase [Mesorhizobium sp. B2-6-3]TPJ90384.1 prepilin peptidase [Mesorhizobium sp. B2-5-10]TPK03349.1 prepilin peptidase [Mesorhizobium sp. B2-5-11]
MKILRARRRSTAAVAVALAAATVPAVMGSPAFVVASALALCLLAAAIAVHDLASLLIPDRYTAGILVVALADWWFEASDFAALAWRIGPGGVLMLLLCLFDVTYGRLRGRDGIGFGDIKLIGVSTVLAGLAGVGAQILLASVAAFIFSIIRAVRLRRPLRAAARVPFGTFLAPALVIIWAWLPAAW